MQDDQPEILEPSEEEFAVEEEALPPQSILYRRPQAKDFSIVAMFIFLCLIFSILF